MSTRTGPGRCWSRACGAGLRRRRTGRRAGRRPVEAALRAAVASAYDVVVTTGGTGLSPTDLTPEMTRRVLDREIPGIAEAMRASASRRGCRPRRCRAGSPASPARTLVVNLPGSPAGCATGWRARPAAAATRSTRCTGATTEPAGPRLAGHPADGPVGLRPIRRRDREAWLEVRRPQPSGSRRGRRPRRDDGTGRSRSRRWCATCAARPRRGQMLPFVVTYEGRLVGQLTVGGVTWGSLCVGARRLLGRPAVAGRGIMPTAVALATDHCFAAVGPAPRRDQHPAGERRVAAGGREARLPRRGPAAAFLHIDGDWRDHRAFALTAEELPPGGLLGRWRAAQSHTNHTRHRTDICDTPATVRVRSRSPPYGAMRGEWTDLRGDHRHVGALFHSALAAPPRGAQSSRARWRSSTTRCASCLAPRADAGPALHRHATQARTRPQLIRRRDRDSGGPHAAGRSRRRGGGRRCPTADAGVLAALVLLTVIVAAVTPFTPLPWWSPLVARAGDARRSGTPAGAATSPARADAHPPRRAASACVRGPLALTRPSALDRGSEAAGRASRRRRGRARRGRVGRARDGPARSRGADGWQPTPVPLPTYVTKPVAPRVGRPIDLTKPGAWTEAQAMSAGAASSAAPSEEIFDQTSDWRTRCLAADCGGSAHLSSDGPGPDNAKWRAVVRRLCGRAR